MATSSWCLPRSATRRSLRACFFPCFVLAVVAPSHPLGRRSSSRSRRSCRRTPLVAAAVFRIARLVRRRVPQRRCQNPPIVLESGAPATLMALASQRRRRGDRAVECQHSAQRRQGDAGDLSRHADRPLDPGRLGQSTVLSALRCSTSSTNWSRTCAATYPGRDLVKRVPPLRRPKLAE